MFEVKASRRISKDWETLSVKTRVSSSLDLAEKTCQGQILQLFAAESATRKKVI
jgi:hypothetical protein